MSEHPLLADEAGRTELLLGNEAIARGAIEAGVGFASGYPGTPSTEVTDTFARLAPELGIPFEYSVNEKVALEMAFAASLAGTRSIVAMKHLGLMSAGDPLGTISYIGTVGGMVIVSAGDPSLHTSPNEQDQRHLAEMLHLPMFDPRTPQEALEVTRAAFELSERSRLPVVVRPTTRVCHTSASVRFGPRARPVVTGFQRDPKRFLPMPANARRMRVEIKERLAIAGAFMRQSHFFQRSGAGRNAILASGAPAAVCVDVLEAAGASDSVTLLSLGIVYPLPEEWLVAALREMDTVIVVEELSPYLEDRVRALCTLHGLSTKILGQRTGHLPGEFEYGPEVIQAALHDVFGLGSQLEPARTPQPLPVRSPTLCVACPHRSAFFAARSVFGDDALYFNDIGCYTLGALPPLNAGDALLSMGAGFTLAAGVARTTGKRTLGFVGDSTFFHSGMPALLNAIKENVNMVAVVMDNQVTAMTGFQESPGVEIQGRVVQRSADIAAVVRALGARHVETIDPNDLAAAVSAFERAKQRDELSVIISQRACPIFFEREVGRRERAIPDDVAQVDLVDAAGEAEATVAEQVATAIARQGDDPTTRGIATYAIDHDRCQHCGRSSCGQRCAQGVEIGFERAMARARSLEAGTDLNRPPIAPCATKCPLFLCIQGYSAHIAAGRYGDALELIMSGLPLADSVCRVCHRPCEDACVLGEQPVAINELKRFVMDWAGAQDEFPYRPQPAPANGKTVAVVGAGPAGLAAAHELALRGYGVRLLDANDQPGGLLATGIPSYRLPPEALRRDVDRILGLGVTFEGNTRLGTDVDIDELLEAHDAVLLAIGTGVAADLELSGRGPAVVQGLDYLNGGGASADRVVVVGGGNTAVDAGRTALRRGASRVVLACLEDRAEMPAIDSEIAAACEEGVELRTRRKAVGLVAAGIELVSVEPRVRGRTDPENFEVVAGTTSAIDADLVVIAVGQRPDPSIRWLPGDVPVSADGPVVDDECGATAHERIFAAGDMADGAGSVTDAIAGGLRAAWGIDRKLRGAAKADERPPPPRVPSGPPAGRPGVWRVDDTTRAATPELDPRTRAATFDEVVGTLTEKTARAEASRCMICGLCGNCNACLDLFGCPAFYVADGLIEIDSGLCVACGVCAQFCPNDAIYPVARSPEVGSL